jgi:CBS domain-containing protein
MMKIVGVGRDPRKATVAAAMTSPVLVIRQDANPADALALMLERHIRHLPVVDEAGEVVGMLSLRHLMQHQIDRLSQDVNALNNYAGAEGIGGD